jgi:hypothetical protein
MIHEDNRGSVDKIRLKCNISAGEGKLVGNWTVEGGWWILSPAKGRPAYRRTSWWEK